ncbi:MAG: pentapeptide repeat-containing protein, partial [Armatimonadota bacterium]
INNGKHQLIVIEGEMGAGKSVLMRTLTSMLAKQYLKDCKFAPIFIKWKDIFSKADLRKSISDQLYKDHLLPLHDLVHQQDLIYIIDGFDEMNSHQDSYITECFNRLADLTSQQCTVVVAMRSTVVTKGLRLAWKNRNAMVAQIRPFSDDDIDSWAIKWSRYTNNIELTGKGLRALWNKSKSRVDEDRGSVIRNPLLLYMLAKYIYPYISLREKKFTRAEIFSIFIDKTLSGKLRSSKEDLPIQVDEYYYRRLLQEIAFIASWPKNMSKCPIRDIRDRFEGQISKELNFIDMRTAFVLHFFEPGNTSADEFEFHPDGFRQYLLAEWCVRAHFDALINQYELSEPFSRTCSQAMEALAQISLEGDERLLLNELFEEIGNITLEKPEDLDARLRAYGIITNSTMQADAAVNKLYERIRAHAEAPPKSNFSDQRIGIPKGKELPEGLNDLRLLVNYWDQCLMAVFGMYRGFKKDSKIEFIFEKDNMAISRYMHALNIIHGYAQVPLISFAHLGLPNLQLTEVTPNSKDFFAVNLRTAYLMRIELMNANLKRADLRGANLSVADLSVADLRGANLIGANLKGANLKGANLREADLRDADFGAANLMNADFRWTKIAISQLLYTVGEPMFLPEDFVEELDDQEV